MESNVPLVGAPPPPPPPPPREPPPPRFLRRFALFRSTPRHPSRPSLPVSPPLRRHAHPLGRSVSNWIEISSLAIHSSLVQLTRCLVWFRKGVPNTLNVLTTYPLLLFGVPGLVLCLFGGWFGIRFITYILLYHLLFSNFEPFPRKYWDFKFRTLVTLVISRDQQGSSKIYWKFN